MNIYKNIISRFHKKNIMVIGDVILDQYIQGSVTRISPEAPVPVVVVQNSFYTPGGAANVANNLRSLSANVTLVGRIGNDSEGRFLKKELKKRDIPTRGIFTDRKLPTVAKTRIMAQHQQICRIDREKAGSDGDNATIPEILNFIKKHMDEFDAVIISDYGKGIIKPEVVHLICELGLAKKKIIAVDPKVEHFGYYRGVTAITPNLKETENAIRNIKITSQRNNLKVHKDKLVTDEDIDLAGQELMKYLGLESLLVTLSERGMRLFEKGKRPVYIKTKAREVFDVTGAGDAVISAYTLALSAGASKRDAAEIANIAAGIVVGHLGAVAVKKEEMYEAIDQMEGQAS